MHLLKVLGSCLLCDAAAHASIATAKFLDIVKAEKADTLCNNC